MRITVKIFLFLALIFCFSCEEQGFFVNCPDCTAEEPTNTWLQVKLDKGYYGSTTVINVYEGNREDSILYSSQIASSTNATILVTLNKKYTLTATYHLQDDIYIAVDSATPSVRYDKEQCDEPCYFVYDKICDLRLKYTK